MKSTRLPPSGLEMTKLGSVDPENFEILTIENLVDTNWRKPTVSYLENPVGSTYQKVKYRSLSYMVIGNELFKKTLKEVLLKCLGESKAYFIVSNVHGGECVAHQAGHNMRWLLCRHGVYWPAMLKDYIDFDKGCQECHVYSGTQHGPASELHVRVKPRPFRGWTLDLIGEIRPASYKGQKYIFSRH